MPIEELIDVPRGDLKIVWHGGSLRQRRCRTPRPGLAVTLSVPDCRMGWRVPREELSQSWRAREYLGDGEPIGVPIAEAFRYFNNLCRCTGTKKVSAPIIQKFKYLFLK